MKLTLQQLEAHLWGAANILRGKTAGQDYKNYILTLMFYKRLCDQWECEADEAIADQEKIQGRPFTEKQKAIFRAKGMHRFKIPDGSRWGDVKAASTNIGQVLTKAMHAVAGANDELRGVFTVDWNQPAPDGSGKPLIPNEVVHALIQHFGDHDLSNKSVPSDVLGRAWTYHVNMRLAASILAAADTLELVEAYRLEDQETEAMRCTVCGAGLKATKTDLPFKVSIDDAVLRRVDEMLARVDGGTELEIIRYAA